jgi:RNA polymerase sigma-70 factor (ECF subfamily)
MAGLPFEEPEDERLFAAVMSLPDRYRTVIHMFCYEDYSVREIAGVPGKKEGTVKSLLSRGRGLLRKTLAEEVWKDDE